jgi:hypothetical protein
VQKAPHWRQARNVGCYRIPPSLNRFDTFTLMTKQYIPFLSFSVLFILTAVFYYDVGTHLSNSYNSTLYGAPSWFKISVMLLLVTVCYWVCLKKKIKVNFTVFSIHVLVTILILSFIQYSFLFDSANFNDSIRSFRSRIIATNNFFLPTQLLFMAYWILIVVNARRP